MKKFVTTLTALLLSIAFAFTVSACTDGGNDDETYEQVTEEQWKKALSLFTHDADLVNTDDLNITLEFSMNTILNGEEIDHYGYTVKVDYANKIVYTYMVYSENNTGRDYIWQGEDGATYRYNEYTDEDGVNKDKYTLEETFLERAIDSISSNTYLATVDFDAYNGYADFVYSEETGGYSHTYVYDEYDTVNYDFIFYFKGGKIVRSELVIPEYLDEDTGEVVSISYLETYAYGENVLTVPEEVLNFTNNN